MIYRRAFALLGMFLASFGGASCLAPTRAQALFFPTFGHRAVGAQGWIVPVHGWLYEPETRPARRRVLRAALRKTLRIPEREKANALFLSRSDAFLARNLRAQQWTVAIGAIQAQLRASDAGGHVLDQLTLPATLPAGWQTLDAGACPSSSPATPAAVDLLEPQGRLVVSDIDDTIKITDVLERPALIARTFLKPFDAVPGMADLYKRWADQNPSTAFCYMSASPWQLFPALNAFLQDAGFPRGVVELKRFRVKDRSFFSLFQSPAVFKTPLLDALVRDFPQRTFILVGDAGEKDPEIYGAFARAHPQQIGHIYIREWSPASSPARYEAAFAGVPAARWTVFRDPKEIPA